MKKQFSGHGINGRLFGYVEVNEGNVTEKGTNAFTHDDYTRVVTEYRVIAYSTGNKPLYDRTTKNQKELLKMVESAEAALLNHLNFLAKHVPDPTYKDQLKDKGYA